MTRTFALRLIERTEDAETVGDPKCRWCHGDGSRQVDGTARERNRTFARCLCRDKLEEAYRMVPVTHPQQDYVGEGQFIRRDEDGSIRIVER